jgi:hypothetical protein
VTKDDRTEGELPDGVADLGEPNRFTSQHLADIDLLVAPADGAVVADPADQVGVGIVQLGQASGEGTWRGSVERRGSHLAEGFVGTLVVVDLAEGVEALLLSTRGVGRWPASLCLEGPVEAFMAAVLLGLAGVDALGTTLRFSGSLA